MLADIFLYHYECDYKIKNLHLYRYIDDIIFILIDNVNCSLPVNYPAYLTVACNNLSNNLKNFLD